MNFFLLVKRTTAKQQNKKPTKFISFEYLLYINVSFRDDDDDDITGNKTVSKM